MYHPYISSSLRTTRRHEKRWKLDLVSSVEVVDVVMASVDGSIRRDDDYIEGELFSDGSTLLARYCTCHLATFRLRPEALT